MEFLQLLSGWGVEAAVGSFVTCTPEGTEDNSQDNINN